MNKVATVMVICSLFFFMPFTGLAQKSKYKCMVQMANYQGEGAYIAVSLIDNKGNYEKTLYVFGPDKQWYNTIKDWHNFQSKKNVDISGITGASATGGDRAICVLEIETAKINKGYKLRFETAVEDKAYYVKDVEIPLTTEALAAKTNGTGYIRFVRFSTN